MPAKAETTLFFAPTRLTITDENPVQEIRVTNMSKIARAYNLSIENLMMNEDGLTMRVDNFNYSAKRMIRFVPRNFSLQPQKQQIVRVMARFPSGTEDGEYHAHIEFLENVSKRQELNKDASPENRAHMNAQVSFATAVPIIISKGEIKTEVGMKNLVVGKDKEGKPELSLDLTRSGNGQGNLYVEADYISPNNIEKKAAVRRSIYIYRELEVRKHKFLLELLDNKDLEKGGKIKVALFNRDISEQEPVDVVFVPIQQP